ncbi:MAG: lysophospholipid acyltransferase family protein [Bacteroidales bacterium]|nr:lysophospholipid acyltransferase family protein [Bacteroidales bacterium]
MKIKSSQHETNILLGSKELRDMANLNFVGGGLICKLALRFLSIDKLNDIYKKYDGPSGLDFLTFASRSLNLHYDINHEELKNIPENGAFVTISNHPYGGIDGIALLKTMLPVRPQFKTLSNYMMSRIKHITGNFIAVDPFGEGGKSSINYSGIKTAMQHLKDGHPLGIFPSGEVSSINSDYSGICDKRWNKTVMRMVQKSKVPVVPIYFHGTNSRMFHFIGRIHPLLRTAKIPSEILNKKNSTIKISIGEVIDVSAQNKFDNIDDYIEFIREKTYALKRGHQHPVHLNSQLFQDRVPMEIEEIAAPANPDEMIKEIEQLQNSNKRIIQKDSYEVFCTKSKTIPALMYEIGRQREIAFRRIGEGSNKSTDLDSFDLTYNHLIIWDNSMKTLVGAYRIGDGEELLFAKGFEGFYTNTLFTFSPKIKRILSQSIELGRSFIVENYQRKALPLYLLWSGIFEYTKRNPHCKYLFGSVSISNDLDKHEKDRIVSYVKQFHSRPDLQELVEPRTPYQIDREYSFSKDSVLNHIRIPVLMRKYLEINGKVIAFNVDPQFNNTLDGLLVLNFSDIPKSFINRFSYPKAYSKSVVDKSLETVI